MCVRMPEGEPCPQGLTHIDHQNRDRAAVADEADDDRGIQNRPEVDSLKDVNQKSGEESSRAEGDDPKIKEYPQPECEAVVHVGLVEPVIQAKPSRIHSQCQQAYPRCQPEQKT